MRTAPAPNIPPIPGMCPGAVVLAGNGDGGGGSGGSGKNGKGKKGAGTGDGENDPNGSQKNAQSRQPENACATDPIDVVTGRVFTYPAVDLHLPSPLPLTLSRAYNSNARRRDVGVGFGWSLSILWEIEVVGQRVLVFVGDGTEVQFPLPDVGAEVLGPSSWRLRREAWGFALDVDDGCWRLFSATDVRRRRFKLTAIQDRNDNRIALTYDARDLRLLEVADSAGRVVEVRTDAQRRISAISVTDARTGERTTFAEYRYDDAGNLLAAIDAEGNVASFEYQGDHRLVSARDRTGLTFKFVYDAQGRGVEGWGDYGGKKDPSLAEALPKVLADGVTRVKGISHCRLTYHPDAFTEVADSTQVRRYYGNRHGTLDRAVAGGGVMSATYDGRGHILSRSDAIGDTTKFERDGRGRVVRFTDPNEAVVTIERDGNGAVTKIVDPEGATWELTNDARANRQLEVDPCGAITSFTYDARGLWREVVSPNGARTTFEHDAHGNLVRMVQPNGGVWAWDYDALGRCIRRVDPLGHETRFEHSRRGDLIGVIKPDGTRRTFRYDGERHLIEAVDESGRALRYEWGGYHRLCGWTDTAGNVVRFLYDLDGDLVEVRNAAGQVHRYEYDPHKRVIAEHTFDGRTQRTRHDALCRPVRVEYADGRRVLFTYGAGGRLVQRDVDGEVEDFTYNRRGELVSAKNARGVFTFERDARGRIVRETQDVDGREHVVTRKLDVMGRLVERTSSLGLVERCERDLLGARSSTTLGTGAFRIAHATNLLGDDVALRLPHGAVIDMELDVLGRVVRRSAHASPAPMLGPLEPDWVGARRGDVLAEIAFAYDAVGEVTSITDAHRGQVRFEYDPVGRLLAAIGEGGGETFRHDAAGNVYGTLARTYDERSRLLRNGDVSYEWDAASRLVERTAPADRRERLDWTANSQLARVEGDELEVTFTYDPFGRRMRKRAVHASGQVRDVRFVWDGDHLLHEVETTTDAIRTYVFGDRPFVPFAHLDGLPTAEDDQRRWFVYMNDAAGAPRKLLDVDGRVACELDGVWGLAPLAFPSTTTTPLRFQGQYEDEETGLYYNRFRYYSPRDARYVSPDPIGLEGGLNPFEYVPNPLAWVDPLAWDWNYRLVGDNGAFYYGRASDNQTPSDVINRHMESGRLQPGEQLQQITPRGTGRDTVRGIEQRGIEHGGPGGTSTMQSCQNAQGNRINGVAPGRTDQRAQNYRTAGDNFLSTNNAANAGGLNALSTHVAGQNPQQAGQGNQAWNNTTVNGVGSYY